MSTSAASKPKSLARTHPRGPLRWDTIVQWLSEDGVISADEARRTVTRCSQAESAQHPLVRLAAVAMERADGGKPLDDHWNAPRRFPGRAADRTPDHDEGRRL